MQQGARANDKDHNGYYVIDHSNNPSNTKNGFGWMPAPGASAPISNNYRGKYPLPGYKR
jgi:hypothetical protein